MILFGERSLRKAIQDFVLHYDHECDRPGLENRLMIETESSTANGGPIQCRRRLVGMLNYCYRHAA
jgi:putative transposase